MKKSVFIPIALLAAAVVCGSKGQAQNFNPLQSNPIEVQDTVAPGGVSIRATQEGSAPGGVSISTARSRRDARAGSEDRATQGASVRAQNYAQLSEPNIAGAPWRRVVYREIDLTQPQNAPLYFPPRPSQTEQNLFTALFVSLNKDQIRAYEYEDLGVENFDAAHLVDFADFLDRFGIMYTTTAGGKGNSRFEVLPVDIPSEAVKSYYIKEEHFFDPQTSTVDVVVHSICPILHDDIDLEGSVKIPLFWVKYTDVKSFLSQHAVMLSDLNNAATATWDDFFRLNLYKGTIAKTVNMRGLSLEQMSNGTPEGLTAAQDSIEGQLRGFKEQLYGNPLATQTAQADEEASEDGEAATQAAARDESELETARGRRAEQLDEPQYRKAKPKASSTKSKSKPAKKTRSVSRSVRNRF